MFFIKVTLESLVFWVKHLDTGILNMVSRLQVSTNFEREPCVHCSYLALTLPTNHCQSLYTTFSSSTGSFVPKSYSKNCDYRFHTLRLCNFLILCLRIQRGTKTMTPQSGTVLKRLLRAPVFSRLHTLDYWAAKFGSLYPL